MGWCVVAAAVAGHARHDSERLPGCAGSCVTIPRAVIGSVGGAVGRRRGVIAGAGAGHGETEPHAAVVGHWSGGTGAVDAVLAAGSAVYSAGQASSDRHSFRCQHSCLLHWVVGSEVEMKEWIEDSIVVIEL